jgi:hypothetical protein
VPISDTGTAANGISVARLDLRVGEVQLRFGAPRARGLDLRRGDGVGGPCVVDFLLAHRLVGGERLQALGVAARLLGARLGRCEIGFRARDCGRERRRIDGVERLPLATRAPSVKLRDCRMPFTRARTSTSREPAVWPVYSIGAGRERVSTVTTATSEGGKPGGGPPEGPQATRNRAAMARTLVRIRSMGCALQGQTGNCRWRTRTSRDRFATRM